MVSHNRLANRPTHYQQAQAFMAWFNAHNAPLSWRNEEWLFGDLPWSEYVVVADLWRYLDAQGWRPTSRIISSVLDALKAVSVNAELAADTHA